MRFRRAFALPDLLVIASMACFSGGILLPALVRVREAADASRCKDNLRQLGKAIRNYADVNDDHLPYCHRFKTPLSGWGTLLLPYLGHEAVFRKYNWELDWFHPDNHRLTETRVSVLQCPAAPNADRLISGAVGEFKFAVPPADYAATHGLAVDLIPRVLAPTFPRHGAMPVDETRRFREIHDGMATTLLLAEGAGRPQVWRLGRVDAVVPPNDKSTWSAWNGNYIRGFERDGTSIGGPCAVNCSNVHGVYAFHRRGANALFADGAVRLLEKDLDVYVLYALVTREGGEFLAPEDF